MHMHLNSSHIRPARCPQQNLLLKQRELFISDYCVKWWIIRSLRLTNCFSKKLLWRIHISRAMESCCRAALIFCLFVSCRHIHLILWWSPDPQCWWYVDQVTMEAMAWSVPDILNYLWVSFMTIRYSTEQIMCYWILGGLGSMQSGDELCII